MIPVKIKKLHPDAVVPTYATPGSAGFDLYAVEDVIIVPGETKKVPLGLAFQIPEGYVMYVCMRSGIALKTKLRQSNGIGVIDSDYRGEVCVIVDNISQIKYASQPRIIAPVLAGDRDFNIVMPYGYKAAEIRKGDRIAQGVIAQVPQAVFEVVEELSETERGSGGFGSTGIQG